jgi:hypothetical protein
LPVVSSLNTTPQRHPAADRALGAGQTLLTSGLFGRDKRRAGTARPWLAPQNATTRQTLPGLASRKNPVLWAFFRVFMGLLTG